MDPAWAAENLQTIRTLMERSALYRRALAPVMLSLGSLGCIAAVAGYSLQIQSSVSFILYWLAVGCCGVGSAYLRVRQQAMGEHEPFWSPPTRRVTQALVLPLAAGFAATLVLLLHPQRHDPAWAWWIPPLWMLFYGCALYAAGFFMPRGMKVFGCGFVALGCLDLLFLTWRGTPRGGLGAHWVMGFAFGGLHLAYALYLYFTEKGRARS